MSSFSHQKRHEGESQHKKYWNDYCGVEVTNEKVISKHYRSKLAGEQGRNNQLFDENIPSDINAVKYDGSLKDRRIAIKWMFINVFGAPSEELWHGMKLIPAISLLMNISRNSHTSILEILQKINEEDVFKYNGKASSGSGNAGLLHQGTEQANIVCNALEAGLSSSEAACLVNFHRERLEIPLEPICRSAVQGFMKRSSFI